MLCFQYNRTARAVLEADESVEILVELLQIYREKSVIFCNVCLLLGILGHNSEQRLVSIAILDKDNQNAMLHNSRDINTGFFKPAFGC